MPVKVSVKKQKSGIAITIVIAIPLFYNMSSFSLLPGYLRQEFGNRFLQFDDIDGLGDKSVASGSTGGFHVIFEGIGGLHDDRNVRVFLPNLFQRFYTVHLRHFYIQQNHIGSFFCKDFQ